MKNKVIGFMAILALTGALVTGCGNKNAETEAATSAPAVETEAETVAPEVDTEVDTEVNEEEDAPAETEDLGAEGETEEAE